MSTIIFDIETGSRTRAELEAIRPEFEAPRNIKDPAKIAAAIEEKHEEWLGKAALCASTGRVVAIGVCTHPANVTTIIGTENPADEARVIADFWHLVRKNPNARLVGFNSNGFDLPFLIRRSMLLGIPYPGDIREGRYWSRRCIDLMESWTLGIYGERISLDRLAKAFGLEGKNGHGAEFCRLWEGTPDERSKARAYLLNDIALTARLGQRVRGGSPT
jgi:predicted PolB exonuclease-like 3'-5' exonuclease